MPFCSPPSDTSPLGTVGVHIAISSLRTEFSIIHTLALHLWHDVKEEEAKEVCFIFRVL